MKLNFRKITAIGASILMAGLSVGVAAAASFPAPFVDNGQADVAIVYGGGALSLDAAPAGSILTALQDEMPTTGTSIVTGGEAFMLDKSSNHFNFNNALNAVHSDLDKDEMPIFLADGTYNDGDVDEDYEQKITLGTKNLSLFADTDYESDTPTVGFRWTNAETILSYEMDLDDEILYSDMVDTDLPLMGKEYYVLAASATQIDVLDSAEKTVITEGEPVTIGGKTISIYTIDANGVKFSVDGENIDKLTSIGDYEEIGSTDSYIVLNDWNYDTRDGRDSTAEFSIGSGKIELIDGEEAELNTHDIDGLNVALTDGSTNSSYFDTITLTWKSDRETFLTETNVITMPGFETIKLVYNGLDVPSDSEVITLDNGDTFTLKMDNFDLPIAWVNSTAAYLGEEDNELILATSIALNTTWTVPARSANLTGGLDLEENDRFIVTNIGTDLTDIETMYYEVTTIENNSNVIEVVLEDLIGDNDLTFDELEGHDRGVITATLAGVNGSITGARAYFTFATTDATIYYNKVVSEMGMVTTLPTSASGYTDGTGATITFVESDKDEDLTEGRSFTVTVKNTTNTKLHVSTHNLTAYDEEESNDHYIGYVPSDLASKIMFDDSADENDFSIEYFGKEIIADVSVTSGDAIITSGGASALGDVMVLDTEIASVEGDNLILVGGSCINTATATVLDGAFCGEAFTAETGVGTGQFMIKGFDGAFTTGKLALVVAGYDAADTVNAATYLRTQTVDTSAEYLGTSTTEATLVTA